MADDKGQMIANDLLGDEVEELQVGHIVKGVIATINRRFSYVKVGKLSCILPVSEISYDKRPRNLDVGTEIEAVVIRISDEKGVMLSIKRAKQDPWKTIDEIYHIGQRVLVKVNNITDYGAFVELGNGIVGLIHKTELSYGEYTKPMGTVSFEEVFEAEIIDIEKERRRIQLSRKRCMENPWEHVSEMYHEGQKITSKVVKIKSDFVTFEIEPGIYASIHKTEMGLEKNDKLKNYISIEDEIEVEICSIDVERKIMTIHCEKLIKNE